MNLCNFIIGMIGRENCIEILAKLHAAFDTGPTAAPNHFGANHAGYGGLVEFVPWMSRGRQQQKCHIGEHKRGEKEKNSH